MPQPKRPAAFKLIVGFLAVSTFFMLAGQTTAVFDYPLTVSLGLQESPEEVGEFGVQVNRAFGAGDTVIYIPLMVAAIIGLLKRTRWALPATAAAMGVSAYWSATVTFLLMFLPGTPDYALVPGLEYWVFIGAHLIFGVCGLLYVLARGSELLA